MDRQADNHLGEKNISVLNCCKPDASQVYPSELPALLQIIKAILRVNVGYVGSYITSCNHLLMSGIQRNYCYQNLLNFFQTDHCVVIVCFYRLSEIQQ